MLAAVGGVAVGMVGAQAQPVAAERPLPAAAEPTPARPAAEPAPARPAAEPAQSQTLPERYALAEIWNGGNGRGLYHPAGLDWDTGGIVFVAARDGNQIANYRLNAQPMFTWPSTTAPSNEPGRFSHPEDVAVDADRELVWVADTGNRRVQVLQRRTGAYVAEWLDVGLPRGITLAADDTVVVSDAEGHFVRLFAPDGSLITRLGGFGRGAGEFDTPLGVDVDADGTIYVADSGNRRVVWLDRDGNQLGALDLTGASGPGGIPLDVAIDDDKTLYVAVERGVLRFRYLTQYAEQISPGDDAGEGNDPLPITDNHEGVRGVAITPGVGMAFSYAPALGTPDRVMLFPERWFPTGVAGSVGPRAMDDPSRVASAGTVAVVLDSTNDLRIFQAGGSLYDPYHSYPAGDALDIAAADSGTPCIPMCSPLAAVTLFPNEARVSWLACFANCTPFPPYEVLPESMRLRQDCRGFDREPDDLWWNRAISATSADAHAVLNAGRPSVTVHRRNPAIPVGEEGWMPVQGVLRIAERTDDFRAFSDVAHDQGGTLYVLARDGGVLRFDANGRGLDELHVDLPGGRTAESFAVSDTADLYVLTQDEFVLKFRSTGELRAGWSVPELAGPGAYTDIALGPDGKILVPDGANDRVLAFARGEGTSELPGTDDSTCELIPRKSASPSRLQLGATTEVTLELDASCPSDALDLVILVETDCGMSGDRLRYLRESAGAFANSLAGDRRVAVVTFSPEIDAGRGGARLLLPLTDDRARWSGTIGAIDTMCLPFIESRPVGLEDGLALARETLTGPDARPEAAKAVVVIAPGRSRRDVVLFEARRLWREEIRVYTLAVGQDRYCAGLPPDEGLLAAIALPAAGARRVADPVDLPVAMRDLAAELSGGPSLQALSVTDWIPANMRLVPGSVDPPPQVQPDGSLRWDFEPAAHSWQMRFLLEPLEVGIWPTNIRAIADAVVPAGQLSVSFPVPTVEVWVPEPTATTEPPTATNAPPTSTATSTPAPPTSTPLRPPTVTPPPTATRPVVTRHTLYLPVVWANDGCVAVKPVDVALVLDTSSSMSGEKLALAKTASARFLDVMALPTDRAAIISFGAEAHTWVGLSGDRIELKAAIDSLTTSQGTRLDLGLAEGFRAVAGPNARPNADAVVVVLTDGRPDGGTEAQALTVAQLGRDLGILTYTIGLGQDVDAALLKEVAGADERYFPATSADLAAIYEAVAHKIPCR